MHARARRFLGGVCGARRAACTRSRRANGCRSICWRLARLVRERRPEIVHCHLFGANWIAKPLAALLGVPVRISHDQCNDALRYESRLARALDRATNRLSSHVCAVSASTRDFLLKVERLPAEKVSLVYNGIDLARYAPPAERRARPAAGARRRAAASAEGFRALPGGRGGADAPRRGRGFPDRGDRARGGAAAARAQALGRGGRVQFLGHVADPRALYAEASVLLMTSRFEGTPLSLLEAMAMRLPIVAPRLDGIGEILEPETEALLVEGRREGGLRRRGGAAARRTGVGARAGRQRPRRKCARAFPPRRWRGRWRRFTSAASLSRDTPPSATRPRVSAGSAGGSFSFATPARSASLAQRSASSGESFSEAPPRDAGSAS